MTNIIKKAAALTAALPILCGCTEKNPEYKAYSRSLFAMDTYMTVTAYDTDSANAEKAFDECAALIEDLEKKLSVTDENSDIYRLNRNGHADVSPETFEIISYALDKCGETDGALDITVYPILREWGFTTGEYHIPEKSVIEGLLENTGYDRVILDETNLSVTLPENMNIDLGSAVKGYTSGRITDILKEHGINSAIADLGGNVQTVGNKPDGSLWKVGTADPQGGGKLAAVLSVSGKAVITSGNYERYFIGEDGRRYCHIIDPSDGYPADNGTASVTVVGEDGFACDCLSTALFVMGAEKAKAYQEKHTDEFDIVIINSDGSLYYSDGLEGHIEIKR